MMQEKLNNNFLIISGLFLYIIGSLISVIRFDVLSAVLETSQALSGILYYLYLGLTLGGAFLVFYNILSAIKLKFQLSEWFRLLFALYFIWTLIVCIRGVSFSWNDIKLINSFYYSIIVILLFPLTAFIPNKDQLFKYIFKFTTYLNIAYLIIIPLSFGKIYLERSLDYAYTIEMLTRILYVGNGLILLTFPLHKKKQLIISVLSFIVALGVNAYAGRRGLIFSVGMPILFAVFLLSSYYKSVESIFFILFMSLFFGFFGFLFYTENSQSFSYLNDRMTANTRESVVDRFYEDLNKTPEDLIWGRGLDGTYDCVVRGMDMGDNNREIVEAGYLTIILKGGYVWLVLYLLLLLPASLKGLFFSSNILAKAAGALIFISILELYPSGNIEFKLYQLLIWICVGGCYNIYFLKRSNRELLMIFR